MARHRWRGFLLLLYVLIAAAWAPAPAQANGLPNHIVRGPAGIVLPGRETAVGVLRETLTFDFREEGRSAEGWRPLVTAEYSLHNPSAADERLEVAFFFLDQEQPPYEPHFTALWNGEEMTATLAVWQPDTIESEPVDLGPLHMKWLDLSTGKPYTVLGLQPGHLKAALFTITVPAGEQGALLVRYRQGESGCSNCRGALRAPIRHYTYLLSPARQWAFFGGLDIAVQAPPLLTLATDPPLAKTGAGLWEGRFETLPEGDFHMSARAPRLSAYLYGAAAAAALVGGLVVWRRRSPS